MNRMRQKKETVISNVFGNKSMNIFLALSDCLSVESEHCALACAIVCLARKSEIRDKNYITSEFNTFHLTKLEKERPGTLC